MLISILLSEGDLSFKLIYVAMYLIAIVISFSFHEWAHAHAAFRNGDMTAFNLGRMTLNPIAHIDPIGFLMIVIVGFGWAKPVPYNSRNFNNFKRGEFQVSLAGIFMNLIIALFSALVLTVLALIDIHSYGIKPSYELILGFSGMAYAGVVPYMVYLFFYILGILNVSLAVFNFIPVYPLDGSHIFDLIFGRRFPKAVLWTHNHGRIILYVIFGLAFVLSRFGISIIGGAADFVFGLFQKLFALVGFLFQ